MKELINSLNEKITVHYAQPGKPHEYLVKEKIMLKGEYFVIRYLRNLSKKELKEIFYHIGCKQVMRISAVSTEISVKSIATEDYYSDISPWKIVT